MTFIITTLIIISFIALALYLYIQQAQFGKAPAGEHLELIKKSPNFRDGKFQNIHFTPNLTEGYSMTQVIYEFFFKKSKRKKPLDIIPSLKTDLLSLPSDKDVLVWFGHSSYFIQVDGKRILVDPVLSGNASPIPGSNKAFKGTDIYSVNDLPLIDYLFISHDHYDHLDHQTIIKLKEKVNKVVCGLGVGSHFERWGYPVGNIYEKDWNEKIDLGSGFVLHITPARHFAGRGFSRNNTLWISLVLSTPSMKLYLGGDSGYDTHFAEIGEKYGPFDLAILDNGQYDIKWKYIHMLPEEVLQAAIDLKAKRIFPAHSTKFIMSNHAWDEPLVRITELNKQKNIPLITPKIGELVNLKDQHQQFSKWWTGIK